MLEVALKEHPSGGYAFVNTSSAEGAAAARLALHNSTELGSSGLRVNFAKDRSGGGNPAGGGVGSGGPLGGGMAPGDASSAMGIDRAALHGNSGEVGLTMVRATPRQEKAHN